MITDERFVAYINSLDAGNPAYLDELEAYAIQTQVPIIRKEMQSFMRTMLLMNKPKRILEVGTAIGFSALLMSEFMPQDGHITTIENYEKRIPIARANFQKYGKEERITLLEGDAAEVLKTLEGPYDFIFMDAAKGQYIHYLPEIMRILAPGGVLISDNVMQDGDIIESKYAITRRDRTIHRRMREYLYTLTHHDELQTSILTLGDGVAVSVRK
ncbi:MAG: O-methyltransferase [Lachnospiraceae bacterium]|nr:O-methyltransferase [Lachnospiraceae bacterium]